MLTEAYDINDQGQIVGTGFDGTRNRAFLLTPEGGQSEPSGAPEPGTLVLLASGMAGLSLIRRCA